MRPAKTLIEHVRAGSFRPERHGRLLAGEDLPVRPRRDVPPAASRMWARMRELQAEYRETTSVELRHDLAREFSQLATHYLGAAKARRDPLKELDGLAEIVENNRRARRLYEAAQARAAAKERARAGGAR